MKTRSRKLFGLSDGIKLGKIRNFMTFRTDIKTCMKDCILAILWNRQEIYDFFQDHSCTSKELKLIKSFKDQSISRRKMVDLVFSALSKRDDGGCNQFQKMFRSLTEWSHFDEYYFDKLHKLDRNTAVRLIRKLKSFSSICHQKKGSGYSLMSFLQLIPKYRFIIDAFI